MNSRGWQRLAALISPHEARVAECRSYLNTAGAGIASGKVEESRYFLEQAVHLNREGQGLGLDDEVGEMIAEFNKAVDEHNAKK